MARKVSCSTCKHLRTSQYPLPRMEWCHHPAAKIFHRVHGYQSPIITAFSVGGSETLKECDANGWWEEYRPWWRFWS